MNRYLLSLGSNENKTENMAKCRIMLSELYLDVLFSKMIETEAFGIDFSLNFYNQLAIVNSDQSANELKAQLKRIENIIGRQLDDKSKGIVKIDLDLLAIDDDIVKHDDFKRPYLNALLEDLGICFYENNVLS